MASRFNVNVWATLRCNFRCRYCYEQSKYQNIDLSMETADNIVDFIKREISPNDFLTLNFHGGEPTLNFNVIKHIVWRVEKEIANEKQFGMTTNGSLLTDEMIDFLGEHFNHSLSISMDGKKETHELNRKCVQGDVKYETILDNAIKLLNKMKNVRIRMTYNSETCFKLYENVKFFIEKGFKLIVPIADTFSSQWTNEDFDIVENEFKKIKKYLIKNKINDVKMDILSGEFNPKGVCSGGHNYYNVDPLGDIYPCTYVVGDVTHKIGNIYSGLDEEKISTIACINNNRAQVQGCKECKLFMYCSSTRCLLGNYASTGDYYKPNLVICALMNIKHNLCGYMQNEKLETIIEEIIE